MQQRQLRLGDILDDYCPRERRVTNHAIVAMVGPDVKQTRCTTCDTEHEFKHAKVPRQRRKSETPAALYSQVLANGPKRVAHDPPSESPAGDISPRSEMGNGADADDVVEETPAPAEPVAAHAAQVGQAAEDERVEADGDAPAAEENEDEPEDDLEEGPVHRPLIRATLPRPEGTPPPTRPAPEFTIRQPGGRQNRFRPRHGRGPQPFPGNRGNGNAGGGPMRSGSGVPRQGGGRPPHGTMPSRLARHQGPGRKRSK
jgi:hypothetical protein